MNELIELTHFRNEILQEVVVRSSAEDGGIKEEKFTEIAIEILIEAQETENARECREIREDSIGRRLHKINGYALSENYETLDLFITIFSGINEIRKILSDDLKAAVNQSTRFLKNAINKYFDEIEETSPIFDFARTIGSIANELVRVNIFVVSDSPIVAEIPEDGTVGDILVKYHLRDIEYLYRLNASKTKRLPIEIDFEKNYGGSLAYLSSPVTKNGHDTYLTIISGVILAKLYKEYGARLLEQNVRSFLQFKGKINKGIRDTILYDPQMFIAFNNGITATAESVELDLKSKSINKIRDFQIVNGGQTTASILQTSLKTKTENINKVSVQVKLTILRDDGRRDEIISRIARYANTQNKVSDADLTSNNPFHIELEKLSRTIWATQYSNKVAQTQWYYERARGQYNYELSKQVTPTRRKLWQARNPKSQMFDKEEMARYWISAAQTPWWVVRGRQRNFIEFMKSAEKHLVDNIFFEDLISKAIIFKKCENCYGVGTRAIGDLRYIVVPYAVALLFHKTDGLLNLVKIWKNQAVSEPFKLLIEKLLTQIDKYMRESAPGGLIGEWGKREECWTKLRVSKIDCDINSIADDLTTKDKLASRHRWSEKEKEDQRKLVSTSELYRISQKAWKKIEDWGRLTGVLSAFQQGVIWNIGKKSQNRRHLSDIEIKVGLEVLDLASKQFPDILDVSDQPEIKSEPRIEFTPELISSIYQWERRNKRLFAREIAFLREMSNKRNQLTENEKNNLARLYVRVIRFGFPN